MKGRDDVFRRQLQSIFVFLFAAFMLVGVDNQVSADARHNQKIDFLNLGGYSVYELRTKSAEKNETWGSNLISSDYLSNASQFTFWHDTSYQNEDIKIVLENGQELFFNNVNFVGTWKLTLYYNNKSKLYNLRHN